MALEITFPLEFIVQGTPVSLQAKRAEARAAWVEQVRKASSEALPDGHFATAALVSVTLFYFPDGPMQGDLDNIVKPILDALSRHVYYDDRQVERVWVQKFEPGRVFEFRNPSLSLATAVAGLRPLTYICVADDPTEGLA